MRTYKLTLEPKSPFITLLQSDTIFGHLAWAIVYTEGEKRLKDILAELNSAKPPFLISAAFPEGKLPTPVLPPLTQKEMEALAIEHYGNASTKSLRLLLEDIKKTKKINYLPIETFYHLAQDLTPSELTKTLLTLVKKPSPQHNQKEMVMHTAIDRITGSAKEGALFGHEETFYDAGAKLTIWLRISQNPWKENLYHWFKIIEGSGFGKRKSTGLGQFHIVGDIVQAEDELPQVTSPNGFITISSYVPNHTDPLHGYYHFIVKRGKLGGFWALGDKVWKKPLIMFAPGSVFYINHEMHNFYGGIIPNVHSDNYQIVQYAFAFPLGIRLTDYKEN